MKMNRLILSIGTALLWLCGTSLSAQLVVQPSFLAGRSVTTEAPCIIPENQSPVENTIFSIEYQLLQEEYALAYWNAKLLLQQNHSSEQNERLELYYALARSAVHFPSGDTHLREFIERYPLHLNNNIALLAIARSFYKQQEYELANTYYILVDPSKLRGKPLNAYRFEAGYCAMQTKEYDRASMLFFSLTQTQNPKQAHAKYYYSYIAFVQEQYAVALSGFKSIQKNPEFEQRVPFFVYSIYYKRGELDSLIYMPKVLYQQMPSNTKAEMARMIGEAYYLNNRYQEAYPYFEDYLAQSATVSDQDRFMIGLCAYLSKSYGKSIDVLSELSSEESLISQQGLYYLGFAFNKIEDDNNAAQAFLLASQQTSSRDIAEEAAFNYAKMRMKMRRNPFNENISSLQDFLIKYPNSTHRAEINDYLMTAYSNSQNYPQALKYMDAIAQPTEEQLRIKQKLNYLYAIDLISKNKLDSAILSINQCIGYGIFDPVLARDAKFWKAEALFLQNNFAAAQILLEDFLSHQNVKTSAYYTPAMYSQAYCLFHLQRYNDALGLFQNFLKVTPHKGEQAADACLRMADCIFMQKKYERAIDVYREALAYKSKDADYCLYQLGFCYGLLAKPKEKIVQLSALIKEYPFSSYRDDAFFERGRTYVLSGNSPSAKKDFEQLIQLYPNGAFTAKSMVELGLIAMNENQRDEALTIYKGIITKYPGTSESRNALLGVKNIYVALSDIESYFSYVSDIGLYNNARKEEKDTLTYAVAENFYLENKCAQAIPAFEKYLQDFPQGKFQVEASYYAGECAYRSQSYAQAYRLLSLLFSQPANSYSEQASLMAAKSAVELNNQDWIQQSYTALLKMTEKSDLKEEARLVLLQQAVSANDTSKMISLGSDLVQQKIEKSMLMGLYARMKAFQMKGMTPEFNKDLEALLNYPKTVQGAEAFYIKAQGYFALGDYQQLEKIVFTLAESGSGQEYWMAKCFLLLGNGYLLKGDHFQAKATIQSVLSGYKSTQDDIHREANELMQLINQAEESHRKPVQ